MKRLTLIIVLATLTGCASLTPRERTVLKVTAGIIVVGAIAAHEIDHGRSRRDTQPVDCTKVDCR